MKSNANSRWWRAVTLAAAVLAVMAPQAARAEMPLAFAVAGVVEDVLVQPGQNVDKGAALARLDTRPFRAAVKAAQAALEAAELEREIADGNQKRVQQLYDDLSTSSEELEQANLRLSKAEAAREKAAANAALAAWELERATLRAAVSGTVGKVPGYPGLVVDPTRSLTPVVVLK